MDGWTALAGPSLPPERPPQITHNEMWRHARVPPEQDRPGVPTRVSARLTVSRQE